MMGEYICTDCRVPWPCEKHAANGRGLEALSTMPDAENGAPTMTQAECRCPDDCDCDGRFACEERAGNTTRHCELVVGHDGWHVAGNHRWQPRVILPAAGAPSEEWKP